MEGTSGDTLLDAEERAESERLYEVLKGAFDQELRRVCDVFVGKQAGQLFGKTEFELRDRMLQLGAKTLETVVNQQRKKGGT